MTTETTFPDRAATTDEWLWLEDIYSDNALAWVEQQNAETLRRLSTSALEDTSRMILEVLDSDDRIPMVTKFGDHYYNFWRDADHPRGIWRRTTLKSYRTESPHWDLLLDIDDLGRHEDMDWVFSGAQILFPDFRRALIRLSPDGGDAVVIREFDIESREFLPAGFNIPHAKSQVSWIDENTIFVSSDFGPGTMTSSSYPRQVRRWRRGEPLATAELIHEIPVDHMALWGYHDHSIGFERDLLLDRTDFFHGKTYVLQGDKPMLVDVPDDADVSFHRQWLLIRPRSDWSVEAQTYLAGSLLATNADAFLDGERTLDVLFTPDDHTSLVDFDCTRDHVILTKLIDVSSQIEVLTPGETGWTGMDIGSVEPHTTISVAADDEDETNDFWMIATGFLQPPALQLGTVGNEALETLKSAASHFDESSFKVEQHFATSADGTRVPYFQVGSRDLNHDGQNPTLLRGYGGFLIPQLPQYDATMGRAWLERGGSLVVANIRGGGEYGPSWHTAALRENRHRAYEDFAAVARDLIDRGVTSPEHLGCMGGSNGGLLVGNMLTHYPELFGAVVCQVPLLDMKRYSHLSAGASWIAEYGDPDDVEDWTFIQTFSPYHNLRDQVEYPPVLFYTATSDDRVGPVQARKMAARMQQRGIADVSFYENREGGHAGSADNAQRAHMLAMSIEFLTSHLFATRKPEGE